MTATPKTKTVEAEVTIHTAVHVEHPGLVAALAAFQAEVPSIRKGNEATVVSSKGSYKYAYADLADITEKALPLLGKHGLAFSAIPTLDADQGFVLQYALRHESGEMALGIYPLPNPMQVTPQALGSAITYARRYTLCAVTGIAPGGDDEDAHAAETGPAQSAPPQADGPSRDWLADAEAAATKEQADEVWASLRAAVKAGNAPMATLDAVARLWRERKDAEAQEQAGEPEATDTDPGESTGTEAVAA